ncbi:MAG: Gfo/Idh/MocA family oxidoreductase, partial [Niameybacter sp.]
MRQVTAIIVGGGLRGGFAYAPYAVSHPHEFKIVGVAEPIKERREFLKEKYQIDEAHCFESWEQILELPKFADAAMICTQDQMHFEPAMMALEQGYHLLLEKPIAPTEEECVAIADKATEKDLHVVVCHVLRYTTLFKTIKKLLDGGRIGQVVAMNHNENVNHIHYSHSFVRGNWGNSKTSTPMILAKCCHDLDIIQWLIGSRCTKVSSFGELTYFKAKNAPEGATMRCQDGCPHSATCPYDAPTVYVTEKKWGASAFCMEPNNSEKVLAALKENDYGRCVFHSDNDVVDHQIVTLNFENGVTVSLTMCAFTKDFTRTLKIM